MAQAVIVLVVRGKRYVNTLTKDAAPMGYHAAMNTGAASQSVENLVMGLTYVA